MAEERHIKATLMDTETGEVIREIREGETFKVISEKQKQFLEQYEPWEPEPNFIKVFPEELKRVAPRLSGTDVLIIIYLIPYISYQTGMITKTGKNDERYPMEQSDITEITRYSKRTIIAAMDSLVKAKVFARNKVGKSYQYFVNPYIFFKGKFINKTLMAMFKEYKNKEEGVTLK
jgi:hypothetical protein